MKFSFKIDNSLKFDISQSNNMKFEMKKTSEKEYIEKELTPCIVSFSADALFADLVLAVFRTEEEEDNLINGN
ncbi:MAG: hypothetical protein K2K14_01600 [Ruminococcus sp.]|nr:hypothetical protein [Ruminococcus sp.]